MTSIRRHLTTIVTVYLVLSVMVGGILIWLWARHSLQEQFDATLLARAELIQATVEEDDGHLEIEFNLTRLDGLQRDAAPAHFQILSRSAEPLIASGSFPGLGVPALKWPDREGPHFQSLELAGGQSFRALQVSFDAVDDLDGDHKGLRLLMLRDLREFRSNLLYLAAAVAAVAAASLACLLPVVRRALRKGLQPLEKFAARTGAIDLNKLPQAVSHEEAPAELRPMVEKLNELLRRVHESLQRERRFTRDVAHELRTPVAELKSITELAATYSDQATPEAFADVREIAGQMESLVGALTLLNRLDAGAASPASLPTPLIPIVKDILGRFREASERLGHTITLTHSGPGVVWNTDAALWTIAVSNLIGNAITYSPARSEIQIDLSGTQFVVRNPAPMLTPEDVAQMTSPYWRKDASRYDQSHSGLGLALVASIARALGLWFRIHRGGDGILAAGLHTHESPGHGPDPPRRDATGTIS